MTLNEIYAEFILNIKKAKPPFYKIISMIMLFMFIHSCAVHSLKEIPKEKIKEVKQDKVIVLHYGDFKAVLDNVLMSDGKISGYIEYYKQKEKYQENYKELHLYLDDSTELSFSLKEPVSIELNNVIKTELFEYDQSSTRLSKVGGFTIFMIGIVFIYLTMMAD